MYTSSNKNLETIFMKEHNLAYLCFLNPNGEYFIRDYDLKMPFLSYSYIYTDGEETIKKSSGNDNIIIVNDATWVLHVQVNFDKKIMFKTNTLYTSRKKSFNQISLPHII